MNGCLFCRISRGELPAKKALETDTLLAFHDIVPQAPLHLLIIPKHHIDSLNDLTGQEGPLMGDIITTAAKLADQFGVRKSGYRLVANCGKDGGQAVSHLHFHLLGGRSLGWPPG